tara:strand:- start:192 stop:446 length:255 start_codon:yes stop_codon:yes gene_type:complete
MSDTIDHTTESGIESNSIEPDSEIDSLTDKPLSKSNPMIAGSSVSPIAEGEMTNNGATSTIVTTICLNPIVQWQSHLVMKPMHS